MSDRIAYAAAGLVLTLGACARDNPMFEQDTDAMGTSGDTGAVGDDGNSNGDSDDDDETGDVTSQGDGTDATDDAIDPDDGATSDSSTGAPTVEDTGDVSPCTEAQGTQALPLLADTFVASDSGNYCNGAPCEDRNFGATPQRDVLNDPTGDGYTTYLLVRFDASQLMFDTILSADLVVSVGAADGGAQPPDHQLAVLSVLDETWEEGTGQGPAGSVAMKDESAWAWSARPTEWAGGDAFPASLGNVLGTAMGAAVAVGGTILVKLVAPQFAITDSGHFSLAVTQTEAPALPLFTTDAFEKAIMLTVTGCNADGDSGG